MATRRFQFGIFEFDDAALQLRRGGIVVRLQTQPARALACLIENADRPVSREQLCRAVWGTETHVDFERGLNFCMSQLRAVLKDDPAQPLYIRTLPKQGYQFIAPGQWLPDCESRTHDKPQARARRIPRRAVQVAAAVACLAALAAATYWFLPHQLASPRPVVAVVRFDNETGNAELSRFSDALTDDVVERLTALGDGSFVVIGNARILRLPRAQRDLNAIAASLRANYVVIGQVQSNGNQTRVLAHLIRMPEETHLWVERMDRSLADPLGVEAEVAQRIADQFSPRVVFDAGRGGSSATAGR